MKNSYKLVVLFLCLANKAESTKPTQAGQPMNNIGNIVIREAKRGAGLALLGVVAGGCAAETDFQLCDSRLKNEAAGLGLGVLASHLLTRQFNANADQPLSTWDQFVAVVIGGVIGKGISNYLNGHKK